MEAFREVRGTLSLALVMAIAVGGGILIADIIEFAAKVIMYLFLR